MKRLGRYYLAIEKWNEFKDSMVHFKIHMAISDDDCPADKPYFRPILQPLFPFETRARYYCFDWKDKEPKESFTSEVPYEFRQELENNWNNLYPGYISDIFESRERKFAEPIPLPKDSINASKDRDLLPWSILRRRVKFYPVLILI